jgi:hypothetical protein
VLGETLNSDVKTVSDLIGLVIVAGIIALQIVQNKKAARETA